MSRGSSSWRKRCMVGRARRCKCRLIAQWMHAPVPFAFCDSRAHSCILSGNGDAPDQTASWTHAIDAPPHTQHSGAASECGAVCLPRLRVYVITCNTFVANTTVTTTSAAQAVMTMWQEEVATFFRCLISSKSVADVINDLRLWSRCLSINNQTNRRLDKRLVLMQLVMGLQLATRRVVCIWVWSP